LVGYPEVIHRATKKGRRPREREASALGARAASDPRSAKRSGWERDDEKRPGLPTPGHRTVTKSRLLVSLLVPPRSNSGSLLPAGSHLESTFLPPGKRAMKPLVTVFLVILCGCGGGSVANVPPPAPVAPPPTVTPPPGIPSTWVATDLPLLEGRPCGLFHQRKAGRGKCSVPHDR
jgi:hypothetical protein